MKSTPAQSKTAWSDWMLAVTEVEPLRSFFVSVLPDAAPFFSPLGSLDVAVAVAGGMWPAWITGPCHVDVACCTASQGHAGFSSVAGEVWCSRHWCASQFQMHDNLVGFWSVSGCNMLPMRGFVAFLVWADRVLGISAVKVLPLKRMMRWGGIGGRSRPLNSSELTRIE